MSITARTLVTKALRLSGAVAGVQVPSADEINVGLGELNSMLAGWALEEWWLPAQITRNVSVAGNTINIGTIAGNDIVEISPSRIKEMYAVADGVYTRLREVNILELSPEITSGEPEYYAYQRQSTSLGVVTLNAIPTKATTYKLIYDIQTPVYELDDIVELPPAHISAAEWGLASLLGVYFGKPDANISSIAKTRFDRINLSQVYAPNPESDYPTRGRYNIYTDTFGD